MAHEVMAQLEAELGRKVNPLEALLRIASDPKQPVTIQVQCLAECLPYLYPKLQSQALAVSRGDDGPADGQAEMMAVVLSSPELVEAAQRMSLAMSGAEPGTESLEPDAPLAADVVVTLAKDSRGHYK